MLVGILAIQGDFAAHAKMLRQLQVDCCYVRTVAQLRDCMALIIPGGESTTILKFISNNNLLEAILEFTRQGKPIFGTCAGAILLATKVINPEQQSLGLIDMTIARNGYGRQLASFIQHGTTCLSEQTQEMVFIRAPKICNIGSQVKILGKCNQDIVCVQQNNCLAATFHPELSSSLIWHKYFLQLIKRDFYDATKNSS